MPLPTTIVFDGSHFRRARHATGLTQEMTARIVDCSQSTLIRIERGAYGSDGPSALIVSRLCQLLSVNPNDLFREMPLYDPV